MNRLEQTWAAGATLALLVAVNIAASTNDLPDQLRATEARSRLGMVVTGSPEATRAGVQILEAGGNAIDAAVAAAFVLGVSDSDASGLGGETYMLIRFSSGQTVAVDGTAPAPGHFEACCSMIVPGNDEAGRLTIRI